ncbi:MAG: response regulator transcription factor [Actinomycetota bacterium]|nr:response regulator transcription factor [Actinomycetota bacterium]
MTAFLRFLPDVEVVADAADGQEALDRLAVAARSGELPDVVVMDMLMPRLGGVEATAQIKERWPQVEVVAVTSSRDDATVQGALRAGATGYVLKDADADDVAEAIRAAYRGEMRLDPQVARALAMGLSRPRVRADELTEREREVLALVGQGRSNRQIATALVISERTARTHVSNILTKLGLGSRTQAALWAVREGLIGASE